MVRTSARVKSWQGVETTAVSGDGTCSVPQVQSHAEVMETQCLQAQGVLWTSCEHAGGERTSPATRRPSPFFGRCTAKSSPGVFTRSP